LQAFNRTVTKSSPFAEWVVGDVPKVCFDPRRDTDERARRQMAKGKSVTCEECFFRQNLLCALRLDEPCPTFRPNGPDGLSPPQQLRFVFREQRRTRSAFAFPTAQEQADRHGAYAA
jgi:hypothetical protein